MNQNAQQPTIQMIPVPPWLDVETACELFCLTPDVVYGAIASGEIKDAVKAGHGLPKSTRGAKPRARKGKRFTFPAMSLIKWLKSYRMQNEAAQLQVVGR